MANSELTVEIIDGDGYVDVFTSPTGSTHTWTKIDTVYVTKKKTFTVPDDKDIGLEPLPCAEWLKLCFHLVGLSDACQPKADINPNCDQGKGYITPNRMSGTGSYVNYYFKGNKVLGYLKDPMVLYGSLGLVLVLVFLGVLGKRKR